MSGRQIMTAEEIRRATTRISFRFGSAMKRAKRRGLARNAATVLGNIGTGDDEDALVHALDDPEPLVAEHATWALEQIAIHTVDR